MKNVRKYFKDICNNLKFYKFFIIILIWRYNFLIIFTKYEKESQKQILNMSIIIYAFIKSLLITLCFI